MYVRIVGGTPYPIDWEEYESFIVRSTEDPDVVIGFRPGEWQKYARQFFRGGGNINEAYELEEGLYDEVI